MINIKVQSETLSWWLGMSKLYTIFDKELNQRMFYLMQDYQRVVVTSITLHANKITAEYGESVTFSARVKDKDNNPVSGSTVSFYNINSRLGAAISDSDGIATFTYTVQHDLSVNARADNVQSNTVAVTMNDYNLTLSSNTPIIQSGSNAVVTAVLTKNGSAYSSQTLSYVIKHGTTTITTGTVTTNSNGRATITYTGTGAGDINFEVSYGALLQETYELEDCFIYHIEEINPTHEIPFNLGTLTSDFILEFDYYSVDTWEWAWIQLDNSVYGVWSSSYDKGSFFGITNLGYNKWIHLTYKYENGLVTMTANDTLVTQNIDKNLPFVVDLYSNRDGTIYKNLKFKAL